VLYTHSMIDNSEFNVASDGIMRSLQCEAIRLSDAIDQYDRTSEEESAYYGYLKDFLINSGVLCGDILRAASNDAVLLAMIGTRTIIEDAINVHYLAIKPTLKERMAVATDWFMITNDPKATKNGLDSKSVSRRAKDAGSDIQDIYGSEYAMFCNYTHSTASRSILNISAHRTLGAHKAVLTTIKEYGNIVGCIADITKETFTKSTKKSVADYLDAYRDSVSLATLSLDGVV
jgi:hypothetical protein